MRNGKTLIFLQNKPFLGALLVQIPFFVELRRMFDDAPIDVLSPIEEGRFFQRYGLCRRYDTFHNSWFGNLAHSIKRLRTYEHAVSMREKSEITGLYAFLTAKKRTGFRTNGLNFFNPAVDFDPRQYMAVNYLRLLHPTKDDEHLAQLAVDNFNRFFADRCDVPAARNDICLYPCGSRSFKHWSINHYIDLANRIGSHFHYHIVLGPGERIYGETISKRMTVAHTVHHEPSLEDLYTISKRSTLTIGNDCGPGHLGLLTGCSSIRLFASQTDTGTWFFQFGQNALIVSDGDINHLSVDQVCDLAQIILRV
jgi:ADP-heptose:LPS heptosyltransferase